jgi:NAD(P)-dependent dehydrogenase (short-subunit alcohol dehydrogenase family)
MGKNLSKTILITGVSSGIGFGAAKAFARRGYKVFGSVRKAEDGARLSKELGENFFPLIFDVTDREAIASAFKATAKELGNRGLGGLINNAGISVGGPLQHQPFEIVKKHFDTNILGMIAVTQAFLPLLGAGEDHPSGPGRIINISSVGGRFSVPFLAAYNSTKFAVEGFSHALRRELLLYGIDVIIIGPGSVKTPIWEKQRDLSIYKETKYFEPLKKMEKIAIYEEKKGLSIDFIGERIARIFEIRRPKTRYAIDPERVRNWIIARLPDRLVDSIIAMFTGLK